MCSGATPSTARLRCPVRMVGDVACLTLVHLARRQHPEPRNDVRADRSGLSRFQDLPVPSVEVAHDAILDAHLAVSTAGLVPVGLVPVGLAPAGLAPGRSGLCRSGPGRSGRGRSRGSCSCTTSSPASARRPTGEANDRVGGSVAGLLSSALSSRRSRARVPSSRRGLASVLFRRNRARVPSSKRSGPLIQNPATGGCPLARERRRIGGPASEVGLIEQVGRAPAGWSALAGCSYVRRW